MDVYERRRAGGAWLRGHRERHGLTVRAMGREIGLDSSQVSNYENGKSAPDDRRAARIAEVLGLPELEVRRHLGLWVPDDDGARPVSTLEAIELDPNLDEDTRAHFRNQYALLTGLTEFRRRSGDPDAELTDEERLLAATEAEEAAREARAEEEARGSKGRR